MRGANQELGRFKGEGEVMLASLSHDGAALGRVNFPGFPRAERQEGKLSIYYICLFK